MAWSFTPLDLSLTLTKKDFKPWENEQRKMKLTCSIIFILVQILKSEETCQPEICPLKQATMQILQGT